MIIVQLYSKVKHTWYKKINTFWSPSLHFTSMTAVQGMNLCVPHWVKLYKIINQCYFFFLCQLQSIVANSCHPFSYLALKDNNMVYRALLGQTRTCLTGSGLAWKGPGAKVTCSDRWQHPQQETPATTPTPEEFSWVGTWILALAGSP